MSMAEDRISWSMKFNSTNMDYKYIDQLLERYWKGETSLNEEEILRSFFSQEDVPAAMKQYQPIFAYEHDEAGKNVLGNDFDQKMMFLIQGEEKVQQPQKAKVVSITERLKPLFKAAAIVAIFLTLGNAIQVPFNHDAEFVGQTEETGRTSGGVSVAVVDSTTTDSMQHTSFEPMATPSSPTLLK